MFVLTDKSVSELVCPTGKKDKLWFDGALKGFGLRATAAGNRLFIFQYPGGRRLTLGAFGTELTTAEARAKAEILRGQVRDGRDPIAERKAALAARLRVDVEAAYTVRRLIEDWDRLHADTFRATYRRAVRGRFRYHLGAILDMPAASVTRQQAVRAIDRISQAASAAVAGSVLNSVCAVYNWGQRRGALEVNPFANLPRPGRVVSRDRVLSDSELGAVWRGAERLGPTRCGLIRFLLLTLARRNEGAGMVWGELDPELTLWTQPADRVKTGKAHIVPLAEPARAILAGLPRGGPADLVFPTKTGKPHNSGFVDAIIVLRVITGSDTWTFHDFRRSGVTTLARLGFAPHVCDRLLNHVAGSIRGTAAIYQRHDFMAERKAALAAWAAHVVACAEGRPASSNIIELARPAR